MLGKTFGGEEFNGDRLSTFMGYLTNVGAGGATAFPAIGVTVWPKKGDAAYWYELLILFIVEKYKKLNWRLQMILFV